MSNLVLPALQNAPNQGLAWPTKKSPKWGTITQTPASMRGEVRVSLTPNPVWNFEMDLSYIKGDLNQSSPTAIQKLLDFYAHMQGAANDWLYLDPYDNATSNQLIGYGDGATMQFQIGRALNNASFEMMQNVYPTGVKVAGTTVLAGPQTSGNYWYSGLENWAFYSQDFTQSGYWGTNGVSSITNTIVAPDGTTTASAITFNTGTNPYVTQFFSSFSVGDILTFSVWLKVASSTLATTIQWNMQPGGGLVGSANSITLTTSWVRYSVSCTVPYGTSSLNVLIGFGSITNGSVIHAWGAQVERNPITGTPPPPSSYVMTTNNAPVAPRGALTFASAPADGDAITVSFNYYYRCHFVEDEWADLEEMLYEIWDMKSLKFQSLIL